MLGIDYFADQSPEFYTCVKGQGVSVILRYYSPTPIKNLDPEEAQAMLNAGLKIITVYETTGGAPGFIPTGDAYFTDAQGRSDAASALQLALRAGQPKNTPIFLAIDNSSVSLENTVEYWNRAYEILHTTGYGLGMYGFEKHIKYAKTNHWGAISAYWQTYGANPGQNAIWQYEQTTLCGASVDYNQVPDDFPTWNPVALSPVSTDADFMEKYNRLINPKYSTHTHNTNEPKEV
jgi:hypothetical protein